LLTHIYLAAERGRAGEHSQQTAKSRDSDSDSTEAGSNDGDYGVGDKLMKIVDSQDGGDMDINMPRKASGKPTHAATDRDAYGIPDGGAAIPV
jgi:hypothetical protein